MNDTKRNQIITDLKMLERLHDLGRIPNRFYYQLNGKTAIDNYEEQREKMRKSNNSINNVEEKLSSAIKAALEEILKYKERL